MRIRPGAASDVEAVARLHTDSWRTAYAGIMSDEYLNGPLYEERLALWHANLATPSPGAALFLAEDDTALLGFVYLAPQPDGRVLLDNLHVRPTDKRRGTGTHLLRHAMHWTRTEHPGHPMFLEVLEANTPAISFYERHGGTCTHKRLVDWPQGFSLPEREYAWSPTDLLA